MTNLFAAGGSLAFIGVFGQFVVRHIKKFYNYFIGEYHISGVEATILYAYIIHNYKRTKYRPKHIGSNYFSTVQTNGYVMTYEDLELSAVDVEYWYSGLKLIIIKEGKFNGFIGTQTHYIKLNYIRMFVDMEKIIDEAKSIFLSKKQIEIDDGVKYLTENRYFLKWKKGSLGDRNNSQIISESQNHSSNESITSGDGSQQRDQLYSSTESALRMVEFMYDVRMDETNKYKFRLNKDTITTNKKVSEFYGGKYLQPELANIKHEVDIWISNQKFFEERGFPWKLGYVLYGEPGVGKTMFIKSLGRQLKLPVFLYSLGTFLDKEFSESIQREVNENKPCIIAFEDFDRVFQGRKNILTGKKSHELGVTFDTVLNCLDGLVEMSGAITIITTNQINSLDPALGSKEQNGRSSRPGRINRVIEVQNPDYEGYSQIARFALKGIPEESIQKVIDEGYNNDLTCDQFNYLCRKEVEKYFFKEKMLKSEEKQLIEQ